MYIEGRSDVSRAPPAPRIGGEVVPPISIRVRVITLSSLLPQSLTLKLSLSPLSSSCRPPASCSACAWPCRRSTSADAAAAPPLADRWPSPRPPSPPVRRRPRRRRASDARPQPRTSSSRRSRRIPDGTTPTDAARSPPLRPRHPFV